MDRHASKLDDSKESRPRAYDRQYRHASWKLDDNKERRSRADDRQDSSSREPGGTKETFDISTGAYDRQVVDGLASRLEY